MLKSLYYQLRRKEEYKLRLVAIAKFSGLNEAETINFLIAQAYFELFNG